MKLNYESLSKRYEKVDFKSENKSYYIWGLILSYFGNIFSIFFAFFYMFPFLCTMFTAHIGSTMSTIVSFIISLIILSAFELIKRKSILNIVKKYFINNLKLFKKDITELSLAILLIFLTFYYSANGFIKMVDNRETISTEIDNNITSNIDNLKNINDSKIASYEDNIKKLEKVNDELRIKLLNGTNKNRSEFQSIIDKNVQLINDYNIKIDNINNDFENKSKSIINDGDVVKDSKNNKIIWDIIFAIVMSFIIEGSIVGGIFYCEKYMHKIFIIEKNKSGEYYDKKSKYKILLKYIYGEGKIGDPIMGLNKLKDALLDRKIDNVNKLTKDFINDMDLLKVFELRGKRKYIKIDIESAIKLVDEMDSKIMILDELK